MEVSAEEWATACVVNVSALRDTLEISVKSVKLVKIDAQYFNHVLSVLLLLVES